MAENSFHQQWHCGSVVAERPIIVNSQIRILLQLVELINKTKRLFKTNIEHDRSFQKTLKVASGTDLSEAADFRELDAGKGGPF